MPAPQYIRPTSDLTRTDDLEDIDRAATARSTVTDDLAPAGHHDLFHRITEASPAFPPYYPTMVRRTGERPQQSTGTSVFGVIDEATPDASDYIESVLGTFGDVMAVETGNPSTTPSNDRNHIVRVSCGKNSTGGEKLTLLVELRQGYSAESGSNPGITSTLGTFISSFTIDVPDSATTYYYRLPTAEATLITDYTDLQLRFVVKRARGGAPRRCRLYWAEIELPDTLEANVDTRLTYVEQRLQDRGQAIDGVVRSTGV